MSKMQGVVQQAIMKNPLYTGGPVEAYGLAGSALAAIAAEPRPIEEYHEDMGDVLWWCWETKPPLLRDRANEKLGQNYGRWLGEPPYVGSPNDLGFGYQIAVGGGPGGNIVEHRGTIGGWPGYHTHFTPLPPMPAVPK